MTRRRKSAAGKVSRAGNPAPDPAPRTPIPTERTFGRETHDAPLALLLLIATLAAFLPALGAEFVWDDKAITANPVITEPSGLRRIWFQPRMNIQEEHYWPVVYSVLWLEWRVGGGTPFLFHLTNILLHAVNALLLVMLLRRLSVPGAWIAGFLFALHPAHVESVAWAIELKDVLSAFLYLLSAHFFLADRTRRGRILSLTSFALALLSKSIAVTLPAVLFLIEATAPDADRRRDRFREIALRLAPFVALAVLYSVADLWFVRTRPTRDDFDFGFDPFGRAATAFRIVWFHIGKFVWPSRTMALHPHWSDGLVPVLAAGTLSIAMGLALSSRPTAGTRRLIGLCGAHFVLTLAPVLGLIPFDFMRHAPTADRYGYLASASLCAGGAALLYGLAGRLAVAKRIHPRTLIMAFALPACALAVQTARFTSVWRSELSLWSHNARWNPSAPLVAMNLSSALARDRRADEAAEVIREAADLHSESAEVQEALGSALAKAGDGPGAEAAYRRAIAIKPHFTAAHYGLGLVLSEGGLHDAARESFLTAVECNPDFAAAHAALGELAMLRGDAADSAAYYARAAELDPARTDYQVRHAQALGAGGGQAEAMKILTRLAEEHPADAIVRSALGAELARAGRMDDASAHLNAAVGLDPSNAEAWNALGIIAAGGGDLKTAITHFERAAAADPSSESARQNLMMARRILENGGVPPAGVRPPGDAQAGAGPE